MQTDAFFYEGNFNADNYKDAIWRIQQMCPFCDKVYDESEYSRCPYCSAELEEDTSERPYKDCPECGGIMYWDDYWECTNCGCEIHTGKDDNDGIIEG